MRVPWKRVWQVLKKLKTELPYDPARPLSVSAQESKQGLEEIAARPRRGSTVPSVPRWMDGARKRGVNVPGVLFSRKKTGNPNT